MDMWEPGNIFQDKAEQPLGDMEGAKMYIYDKQLLRKESFTKHLDQTRVIFSRLITRELTVNAPVWSFVLKDMT